MQNAYQIVLPRQEWETLMLSLTQYDNGRQDRINAFFNSIDQDISVRVENSRAIIESNRLDDAAIFAALNEAVESERFCNNSVSQLHYNISATAVIDVRENYAALRTHTVQREYDRLLDSFDQIAISNATERNIEVSFAA